MEASWDPGIDLVSSRLWRVTASRMDGREPSSSAYFNITCVTVRIAARVQPVAAHLELIVTVR